MFSKGQIIFSIFFIVVFVLAMIFTYRKDKNTHHTYYKGSKWIVLAFILFVAFLFALKKILNF